MSELKVGSIISILELKAEKKDMIKKTVRVGKRVYHEKDNTAITVPKTVTGRIREINKDGYVVEFGRYNKETREFILSGEKTKVFSEMYIKNCARLL